MDPEETDTFVRYSRSMQDLASIFKIAKKEKSLTEVEKNELVKKKNFKRSQIELSKMIFGVGITPKEMKNKTLTFRIVPS